MTKQTKWKSIAVMIFFLAAACGTEENKTAESKVKPVLKKDDFVNNIKSIEEKIHASVTLDSATAELAIKAYSDFAFSFPEEKDAPESLFKAAEISSSIGQYERAIIYYQTICDKYHDYTYAADCLYLQGYIYDSFLNNDAKAKEIYENIISKYPNHKYAADAKAALQHLGKSDEELIMEFKKKNKEEN